MHPAGFGEYLENFRHFAQADEIAQKVKRSATHQFISLFIFDELTSWWEFVLLPGQPRAPTSTEAGHPSRPSSLFLLAHSNIDAVYPTALNASMLIDTIIRVPWRTDTIGDAEATVRTAL